MNQPNQKQIKWIALSALIFFVLSGGVYKIASNRGKRGATEVAVSGSSQSPSVSITHSGTGKTPSAIAVTAQTSGTPAVTGLTTPAAPAALANPTVPAAAATPVESCVTITYHHKNMSSHTDEESCSHHKNLLKIASTKIAPQNVCVRVNGTPVHYLTVKGRPDELIFGAVAGPKTKVTAQYCLGSSAHCARFKEDCSVPKDEFMEAIGGGNGGSQDARLGQWDPKSPSDQEADVMAKLDGEVKKELETNDDLNGRAPAGEMFKEWIVDNETTACGIKQASN